jgi:hypothetical protein
MRPIVGLPLMAFVERSANWMLPMSLLLLQGLPKTIMDLFMVHTKGLKLNRNRDKSILKL